MKKNNKGYNISNLVLLVISIILIIHLSQKTYALTTITEKLNVSSCIASGGCNATDWNTYETPTPALPHGSTLTDGQTDNLTLMLPSTPFSNQSLNLSVSVRIYHMASNNKGTITYTFRNSANTLTYCSSSIAASPIAWTLSTITPSGCNWNYTNIRDVVVSISVTGMGNAKYLYNDFLNFTINYSHDITPPEIALNNPQNDTWSLFSNTTFFYTPSDESQIINCTLIINGTKNQTNKTAIINGTQNNITSLLPDGFYSWTINCTDSWGNNGTNTSSKLVKIDTTPPIVNIESPSNNTLWTSSSLVTFRYNTTDIMTNISSCKLIVDGNVRATNNTITEGVSQNFVFSPGNGQHNWSINCTDGNGFENSSFTNNLTVNYAGRTILFDKPTYVQGETALISGNNWNDVIVTINLTLSNGTNILWNTTPSGGVISTSYFINYSNPLGQYNLTAYEFLAPQNNASGIFAVSKRIVTLYTNLESYYQGEKVNITGTGFSPNSIVTLIINYTGGNNLTNLTSSPSGNIEYIYPLNYTATLGVYNITAYDFYYKNLNSTKNFSVTLRIANITTNKLVYSGNENVIITGLFYSLLGIVNITIVQNATGLNAPTYPKDIGSNSTGGFIHTWNATDACPGVYYVKGTDKNYAFLNSTSYFNLTNAGNSRNYSYLANACLLGTGACTINNLLSEDGINQTLTVPGGNNPTYFEINFTGNIANDAGISFVRLAFKHYVLGTTFSRIDWYNSTSGLYQTISGVAGCTPSSPATNTLEYCDMSSRINNGSQANKISLRIYYARNVNPNEAHLDYARMDFTATGSGACTPWSAQPPLITAMLIEDSFTSPSNQIDLVAGTTTLVTCNITAFDTDGYSTISGANATLYYYLNKSTDNDNNNEHYTNPSCTMTGDNGGNEKYFSCSFNIWYYANNGTWFCNATTWDNTAKIGSAINSTYINSLVAINITPIIADFGNLETGAISSSDSIITIKNIGNTKMDLGIDGYGTSNGDGVAMNCSDGNSISMNDERYSLSASQGFNLMTPITDTLTLISNFDLSKQSNATIPEKNIYWKVQATPPARGNCQGVIVLTASIG